MSKIRNNIRKLIFGKTGFQKTNNPKNAVSNQWGNVKDVWNSKKYTDFGIERLVRLVLVLSAFIFPGIYIRDVSGRFGLIIRKIAVEVYIILKLLIPVWILFFNHANSKIYLSISVYFMCETLFYLASLVFLSDEYTKPISYKRSVLALFINYLEVSLNYAVIYLFCNGITGFYNVSISNIQAVYFSFITSATVGYGDITVKNEVGQLLVVSQVVIFLVFAVLFINTSISNIQNRTYLNNEIKKGS